MPLEDLFTHIEVLNSCEPALTKEIKVVNCPFMESTSSQRVVPATFASFSGLLETGCKKVYDDSPNFEMELQDGNFVCRCQVGVWKGVGISTKKRDAKQLASKEVLLQIVREDRHSEFSIHNGTQEEALEYLNQIHTNLKPELKKAAAENWFQECNKLCKSRGLENPSHAEITEEGVANDKIFCATVTVRDHVAVGKARKKQEAKSNAYKNLYDIIVKAYSLPDPMEPKPEKKGKEKKQQQSSTSLGGKDKEVSALLIHAMRNGEKENYEKSEALLRKLLNVKDALIMKIFDVSDDEALQFSLSENNAFDNIQAFLVIKSATKNRAEVERKNRTEVERKNRTENVFGGQGPTEQAARDNAAWQALQFLYIFCGFSSNEIQQ